MVSGLVLRLCSDLEFVDRDGEVDPRHTSLKGRDLIQLRRGYPQISLLINPHRIGPVEPRILDKCRHFASRRDLQDASLVDIAQVDVAVRIDRRPAGRRGVDPMLHMTGQFSRWD
jgi:hypothetical protein